MIRHTTRFTRPLLIALIWILGGLAFSALAQTPYGRPASGSIEGLAYEISIYPNHSQLDPSIPTPDELLGFGVGERSASSAQIVEYAHQLAERSDRVEVVEYARTYENRPLIYLVISSPENLARAETIQANMARLADPRDGLSERARDALVTETPAVAWMSYSIHGNENSGSDASLVVMHHLAADQSQKTQDLLDELVVIVDPNKNPDGRERHINALDQNRSLHPNIDDQSLLHSGYWPYGRGNHYMFDLNRDWIYARHPETRGRIRAITQWRPVLLVDAHEMGAQDTFLFSPAREPHNPNLPPYRKDMGNVFADDQARAYDAFGYPYYSGEWHEDWYPGYTDAWASMRGALGILYEQARLAEDGVQRLTHNISYKQSVHHQVISSIANLETLARERETMLGAFAKDRADVVSSNGPYAERSWVILPTDNVGRLKDLLNLVEIQDFEIHQITQDTRISQATNPLGQVERNVTLPKGSLVLRNRQPEARSLAAMFEFDPQISEFALTKEREMVLGEGGSTIYDTTGWNITMMFGLDAYEVPEHLTNNLEAIDPQTHEPVASYAISKAGDQTIALVASGADDRANALAARLMEQGVFVRANQKTSALDGMPLPVGSIAITADDNRQMGDWIARVEATADALGLPVHAVEFGRAPGDLADLGGRQWRVLTQPQIALISRGMTNMLDVGAVWWMLDHRLGIRSSQLDEKRAGAMDLRRYNVVYLPERWGGSGMPQSMKSTLKTWVEQGGTLIAVGSAARGLMAGDEAMVSTRMLDQVIEDDMVPYQDQLHREWAAWNDPLPANIWGQESDVATYPWSAIEESLPSGAERKRKDQWQSQFMPSGALVATRSVGDHWLSAGRNEFLSVLFSNSPVLMTQGRVEAVLRLGQFVPQEGQPARHLGWAPVPEGHNVAIRMGGLLWPEARERIVSSAYVTRERMGRGQVILFAHAPAFRAAQLGAMRILENAMILGPGMGASEAIDLP